MATLGALSSCAGELPRDRAPHGAEPAPPAQPAADRAAPPPASPRCAKLGPIERVEVELGQTARTAQSIAVTYKGASHDSYDGGRTDVLLHLVFQGVMDDGELTPSAMTWMPSALAPAVWHDLPMSRCVRVVTAGRRRVVLELAKPSSR